MRSIESNFTICNCYTPFLILLNAVCISILVHCEWIFYNPKVSFSKLMGIEYVSCAMKMIFPFSLGTCFKAVFLKRESLLSYKQFIYTNAITSLILLSACCAQIGICFLIKKFYIRAELSIIIIFFLCPAFFAMIRITRMFFPYMFQLKISPKKIKKFHKKVRWLFYQKDKIVLCFTESMIFLALKGLIFSFIFDLLGFHRNFSNAVLYSIVYLLSTFIKIVPDNIGITEIFVGIYSCFLGVNVKQGIAIAFINRVMHYLTIICGAFFIGIFMQKKSYQNDTLPR